MTLEHGKTHCRGGLITDSIAYVVKVADEDMSPESAVWRGIY